MDLMLLVIFIWLGTSMLSLLFIYIDIKAFHSKYIINETVLLMFLPPIGQLMFLIGIIEIPYKFIRFEKKKKLEKTGYFEDGIFKMDFEGEIVVIKETDLFKDTTKDSL